VSNMGHHAGQLGQTHAPLAPAISVSHTFAAYNAARLKHVGPSNQNAALV